MFLHNWAFLWGTGDFPTINKSLCREEFSRNVNQVKNVEKIRL